MLYYASSLLPSSCEEREREDGVCGYEYGFGSDRGWNSGNLCNEEITGLFLFHLIQNFLSIQRIKIKVKT